MSNRVAVTIAAAAALLVPQVAQAELKRIEDKSEFMQMVQGKTLSRPLVRLTVTADGRITGRGVTWDVTGSWDWKNGFFCRDLNWGGDDLGYNCQAVLANGSEMRFIADQGAGQSADFRLR
ncbi:dihydrodipicolinate reductase [Marivita sp. XM-24bin2]|uniref:dihydrodipicolinate reductase n=1 Tax=unclassified Marivita TaxID=2632480 RepID=UPI000D79BAAE|nr:dihydrodipicolinate reductase [Marivita sp. XM-24bin2]MCR9110457.1 dihydrodipicolinate reductase [Paracoccaceae bacterium]PWL36839.1 MAG: dihydrodipicolinate reductase [Marivita sp. XM-24bin2]